MLLTYREETKQPLRPIAGLPAPWVLSSAGKLIRYLLGSYFLPYRNTVSTPDVSGAARQNTIELIIRDAVYTGCCAATWQIPYSKLLPRSIHDILTQLSSVDNCRVRCRHGVSLLLFRRRFLLLFFYPPSLSFCRRSARLMSVMCTERSLLASWVDTPLTADWLQVCCGTPPRRLFLSVFEKMHTPPLKWKKYW